MSNKSFKSMTGKGYIALLLCAAAIGSAGYLYYRNQARPPKQAEQKPVFHQEATRPRDVETAAEKPETPPEKSAEVFVPQEKTLKTGAPVAGETVHGYAVECLSYNETTRDWRTHDGVDYAAQAGTQVCAAAEGTVYTVYEDDTMGTTVVIRHADGYATRYASLSPEVSVKAGDAVKLGQAIGCVGTTALVESSLGDHVHFSVTHNDTPMDPAEFLTRK